jgi:hypothetical protein
LEGSTLLPSALVGEPHGLFLRLQAIPGLNETLLRRVP